MVDRRVTEDTAILGADVASGDLFDVVDVSDTTDAATGTNKSIRADQLPSIPALVAAFQALDADLTEIAALTTTAYGRALLELANAAAADWITEALIDAKGDLIAGTAADTPGVLTAGANDTILMADSGQSTGLKWVASATPSTQAFGDAASAGTGDTFTRGDHKHAMPSAADVLTALLTVDGAGSGLDADLLDGNSSAAFLKLVAGGAAVEDVGAIESNVNTVAATGSTETLDTSVYAVHDCTMDQNCEFTFSNPAPSGKNSTFMLILRGSFTPTLPASVDWGDAAAPTYTTPSVYVFTTVDAGTTWLGAQTGKAFG